MSLITKRNIEDYAKNTEYLMVVVYAKFCVHCQNMIKKLGDKFQQYDKLIFLEDQQVDDDYKDFYPHVHIYKYGIEYDGKLDDLYNLFN